MWVVTTETGVDQTRLGTTNPIFTRAAPGAATVVRLRFESPAPNSQITIDLRSRRLFLEQRTAGAYSTEFLVGPNDDSLTLTSRNEAIVTSQYAPPSRSKT